MIKLEELTDESDGEDAIVTGGRPRPRIVFDMCQRPNETLPKISPRSGMDYFQATGGEREMMCCFVLSKTPFNTEEEVNCSSSTLAKIPFNTGYAEQLPCGVSTKTPFNTKIE